MKIKAFTMIEVMMALVVVSIMLAVLAPVIITPPGNKSPEVQVMDTTPVGVIVAWWGTNLSRVILENIAGKEALDAIEKKAQQ